MASQILKLAACAALVVLAALAILIDFNDAPGFSAYGPHAGGAHTFTPDR